MTGSKTAHGNSASNPLTPGITASVSFTVTPAETTSSMKVWATAKTSVVAGDPKSDNDTADTMLYVNHKPKAKNAKASASAGGKGGTAKAWITIKVTKKGSGYSGKCCFAAGC